MASTWNSANHGDSLFRHLQTASQAFKPPANIGACGETYGRLSGDSRPGKHPVTAFRVPATPSIRRGCRIPTPRAASVAVIGLSIICGNETTFCLLPSIQRLTNRTLKRARSFGLSNKNLVQRGRRTCLFGRGNDRARGVGGY